MATRRPIVLVSGISSELPVGDDIDGALYQGQQIVAGSGLAGGGLFQTNPRVDVALAANPSGLYFTGGNKLGFDGQGDNIQVIASGVGAVYRTVQDKGRDVVSVKDFGAVGDGSSANASLNTNAFNAALTAATGAVVYVPPGNYIINNTITIPSDTALVGDATYSSLITAADSMSNSLPIISLVNKSRCFVGYLRLNGNKTNRGTGTGNNITIEGSSNSIYSVVTVNAPNSGFLLDGQTYTCDLNRISECTVEDNAGVGLSQHTARQTFIENNFFARNGLENLTIDNTSYGSIVTSNRFFKHLGGCGNIGWDDGDSSIFSNNYIDNENDTTATSGNRNGICVNAEAGVNDVCGITGNVILNCVDYGIYLRDRSGSGGYLAGSTAITGNIIRNSGVKDIRVGSTAQLITVKANNYDSIEINDPQTDVRLGSAEIAFETGLNANQTLGVSTTFSGVNFIAPTVNRFVVQSGNQYFLPAGGFYQIESKLRFTGLTTAGVTEVSAGVFYPGGSKIVNQFVSDSSAEIDLSITKLINQGSVYVSARCFGGSGSVVLPSGSESYFSCVLLG